jgi:sec-independent protein translocase protein TatB
VFNVGPLELMVLAIVGLVVLGPDRLPGLARDAARMIRSLRDLATGAREQLRDELGPEFADMDLRNLNPRTALQRVVLGEDVDWAKYDPRRFDPRAAARDAIFGDDEPASDEPAASDDPVKPVSMDKRAERNGHPTGASNGSRPAGDRPRPRPRPGPSTPYDSDAT